MSDLLAMSRNLVRLEHKQQQKVKTVGIYSEYQGQSTVQDAEAVVIRYRFEYWHDDRREDAHFAESPPQKVPWGSPFVASHGSLFGVVHLTEDILPGAVRYVEAQV
jgi:hypothetical protein